MKYKVGDKVRIRKDLVVGEEYGGHRFTKKMDLYKGKILLIFTESSATFNGTYNLEDIENRDHFLNDNWTDQMLEPYTETRGRKKYKVVKNKHGELLEFKNKKDLEEYNKEKVDNPDPIQQILNAKPGTVLVDKNGFKYTVVKDGKYLMGEGGYVYQWYDQKFLRKLNLYTPPTPKTYSLDGQELTGEQVIKKVQEEMK